MANFACETAFAEISVFGTLFNSAVTHIRFTIHFSTVSSCQKIHFSYKISSKKVHFSEIPLKVLSDRCPAFWPWPARPTQSMFGVPTHGKLFFELFLGFAPTAASRHCEEVRRSNPDIQQTPRSMSSLKRQCGGGHLWLRFIVSISFSEFYPTANDNKRLLSTTNV